MDAIKLATGDPGRLERLYRDSQTAGSEAEFREALRQCEQQYPGDLLFEAWAERLNLHEESQDGAGGRDRYWWAIIAGSVLLGLVSVLLTRGKPPIPVPGEGDVLFWTGWGPLMALGLLAFLTGTQRSRQNLVRYGAAGGAVLLMTLYVGLTMGSRADDVAALGALHLPFICWACVGAALCFGYANPAAQCYAYLVKSAEALLTGGIFLAAGMVFVGLTYGIFAVLGVQLDQESLRVAAAWGLGAIPLLAVGSVYDATVSPAAQDWYAGMTRTLRILARLLLPLALGVLLVYVLWFIPVYFSRPFEEREVLIVYNATILAIMLLLIVVVSGPADIRSLGRGSPLCYVLFALAGLTLILNLYALAAITGRILDSGLTPNRFAVAGWNITTLLILAAVGIRHWRTRQQPWLSVLRESIGLTAGLAVVWAVILLIVLPLLW